MKVYEALAEVKTLRTTSEQLSKLRESSLLYDADSDPDFKYEELSEQIDQTLERETALRVAIQTANLANKVKIGETEVPLARAILDLSNIRQRLANISSMLEVDRRTGLFAHERRTKEEVPQRRQKSKAELLETQMLLRKQRNALDAAIQEANHKIEITV